MRVERPYTEASMTTDEARAFLMSWWRVVASDGSTIAYVPDETTARLVRDALAAGERR